MINHLLPVGEASDDVATFLKSKHVSFLDASKMEELKIQMDRCGRGCARLQEELAIKKDWLNGKIPKPNTYETIAEVNEMIEMLTLKISDVMKEISNIFNS